MIYASNFVPECAKLWNDKFCSLVPAAAVRVAGIAFFFNLFLFQHLQKRKLKQPLNKMNRNRIMYKILVVVLV